MIFIFNSTPLIYLCKAGLDWIFQELDADCIIPDSVYEEVVIKGKHMGSADAIVAEKLVKNGIISVQKIENNSLFTQLRLELHRGVVRIFRQHIGAASLIFKKLSIFYAVEKRYESEIINLRSSAFICGLLFSCNQAGFSFENEGSPLLYRLENSMNSSQYCRIRRDLRSLRIPALSGM